MFGFGVAWCFGGLVLDASFVVVGCLFGYSGRVALRFGLVLTSWGCWCLCFCGGFRLRFAGFVFVVCGVRLLSFWFDCGFW